MIDLKNKSKRCYKIVLCDNISLHEYKLHIDNILFSNERSDILLMLHDNIDSILDLGISGSMFFEPIINDKECKNDKDGYRGKCIVYRLS